MWTDSEMREGEDKRQDGDGEAGQRLLGPQTNTVPSQVCMLVFLKQFIPFYILPRLWLAKKRMTLQ